MHFDVIIIGSGPAGCAAAISCRQHGFQTLLIAGKRKIPDRDNKIQASESVHPGIRAVLSSLHAAHCIDVATKGVYEGIYVNDQFIPLGEDENGPWQGIHINRIVFDETFLQTAVEKGIHVLKDESVENIISSDDRITGIRTTSGKQINCRHLVDASGRRRIAGKKLQFKTSYFSPPLVAWTGVSEGIPADSFLFKKISTYFIANENGWTWLAPELPDRCTWTRLQRKSNQRFLAPAELRGYSIPNNVKIFNKRWRVFRPVCKEGVLLCGDAAGIIDPAAGQGILNAVVSACMAVKTIKACFDKPDVEAFHLAKYDNWYISDYLKKVNQLRHFYELHGIKIFDGERNQVLNQ